MFLPPQDGVTCTKSVAEYLIILCSRKVFVCGGGSWFKPKVKIFLLNWNKHISVTSTEHRPPQKQGWKVWVARLACWEDLWRRRVRDSTKVSLKAKPLSYPLAVPKASNTAQGAWQTLGHRGTDHTCRASFMREWPAQPHRVWCLEEPWAGFNILLSLS